MNLKILRSVRFIKTNIYTGGQPYTGCKKTPLRSNSSYALCAIPQHTTFYKLVYAINTICTVYIFQTIYRGAAKLLFFYKRDLVSTHAFLSETTDHLWREKWRIALEIGKKILKSARVCSKRFLPSNFFSESSSIILL